MNSRYTLLLIKALIKCDQNLSGISELQIVLGKTWRWLVLSDFSDEISCFCLLGPAQTGSSITEEFPGRGKSLCFSWCFRYCFTWVLAVFQRGRVGTEPLIREHCRGSALLHFAVCRICVWYTGFVLDKLNWSNHFAFSIPEHKLTVAVTQVAHANSLCFSDLMVWTLNECNVMYLYKNMKIPQIVFTVNRFSCKTMYSRGLDGRP